METVFQVIPDTVQDSLSIYLRANEEVVRPDVMPSDFGPYEYLPLQSNRVLFDIDSVTLGDLQAMVPGNMGVGMTHPNWMESAFFLIFVGCFVLFSLVFRSAQGAFVSNFKNGLYPRKIQFSGHKVQVTTSELWGEFFMIFQTIMMISIFIFTYLFDELFALPSPASYLVVFIAIFAGLGLIAGIKYAIYRVVSSFFLSGDLKSWIGRYYRHAQLLGILLFLPVLLFVFLQEYRNIMTFVVLFLFFINRLIVIISVLNIFVKNKIGAVYFFSYLCGTEIAPYLLFYKGVVSIINIAGNYLV